MHEGPDRFDISFRDGPHATWARRSLALAIDFGTVVAMTIGPFILLLLCGPLPGWLDNWFTLGLWFVAVTLLYPTLLESSPLQGTLGKIALGLKVTDLQGQRLSVAHAFVRTLRKIICLGALGPFILIPVFGQRKQAFHDQWSDCLVLYRDYSGDTPPITPPSLDLREPVAPPHQEGITARGGVQEPKRP
jgi:uncharacterized RDD family membrane protein YckC